MNSSLRRFADATALALKPAPPALCNPILASGLMMRRAPPANAVTHALLGGLIAYALFGMFFADEGANPPVLDKADALAEVIMRALART